MGSRAELQSTEEVLTGSKLTAAHRKQKTAWQLKPSCRFTQSEAALVTLGGQQVTTWVALLVSLCPTDHLRFRDLTVQHGQSGGHRQGRKQGRIYKNLLTLFNLQISCWWLIKFVEQYNLHLNVS